MICEPTLLLDEKICKTNIRRMAQKAQKFGLTFKPHMKTHQSAEIGRWFKEAGVESITVSSIKMAQHFAQNGWDDITIAFPVNIRQAKQINDLASEIQITILVTNEKSIELLNQKLQHEVNAYIEIDTGGHRSGIKVSEMNKIEKLIKAVQDSKNIRWIGFYSHPGHSYQAQSKQEILEVHRSVLNQIRRLKNNIEPVFGPFQVCIGDTPCCSVADNFEPIDAISPGNFVFYDIMQYHIGSCDIKDIAVAMECPIVDKYDSRNELIIYGGAIHFSKEADTTNPLCYGRVAIQKENFWQIADDQTYLKKVSQEHGIIHCSKKYFNNYNIGDTITILPIHSCLTANLIEKYHLFDGRVITQF